MTTILAERALRKRRFKWGAWVLRDDDLWFWISWHWTKRGARRAARRWRRIEDRLP